MGVAGAAGAGLPLVLLPGMDGTAELREDLITQLRHRRPAHLISFPEDEGLGYAALTALVRAQLPAGRFLILGESFSGPIAIELAAALPRVAGLVLASSFARRPVPVFFAPLARHFDPRWLPRRLIDAALFGHTGTTEQRARLHAVLARLPAEVLQVRAAEACRIDKLALLASVTCPVMFLRGSRDRLVLRHCQDQALRAQPNVQVQTLDAAHMVLNTHAAEAARCINAFCDRSELLDKRATPLSI
jgi:pimeloyl-[acyl-carrier protein] methyl ester esterase